MATLNEALMKFTENPAIWRRVQEEMTSASDRQARFVELAREQGIELDPADVQQALERAHRELSEEELESVAGGFNPQPEPPATPQMVQMQPNLVLGLLLPAVQKKR